MSFQDAPGHPKRRLLGAIIVIVLMSIGVVVAIYSVISAPEGGIVGEITGEEESSETDEQPIPDESADDPPMPN